MGIRRKALQPHTFRSTGDTVAAGQIACVSAWELMHDSSKYPNADTFDGHRFIKMDDSRETGLLSNPMRGTSFTDPAQNFPIWGLGSKAW